MKTAVSIPDALFEEVERQAKKDGVSRSQLYAEALAAYLMVRREEGLTEGMNRALEGIDQTPDLGVQEAGRRTFQRSEWI